MTLLRRFLVLAALLFWQGGFTFYAAVVVPVGTHVLGSVREQARVTGPVTRWLNVSGAAALSLLFWELWASRDDQVRRRRIRVALWAVMSLGLAALFALHPWLDARFNAAERTVEAGSGFRLGHKAYLIVSTVQWFCSLGFLAWSLAAWREEDRQGNAETKKVPPLTTSASPSHRSSPAAEQS